MVAPDRVEHSKWSGGGCQNESEFFIMPNWQQWVGLLALVVAIVGVYYQWRQIKIMETQATAALDRAALRRGEAVRFHWWNNPALLALVILVILAWIPYFVTPHVLAIKDEVGKV
jgi:protein-S-isoprenylcysteine O-methyltransferase Ste14